MGALPNPPRYFEFPQRNEEPTPDMTPLFPFFSLRPFFAEGPAPILDKLSTKITKKSSVVSLRIWIVFNGCVFPTPRDVNPKILALALCPHADSEYHGLVWFENTHITRLHRFCFHLPPLDALGLYAAPGVYHSVIIIVGRRRGGGYRFSQGVLC